MPKLSTLNLMTLTLALPMMTWACVTADRAERVEALHPGLSVVPIETRTTGHPARAFGSTGAADCVDGSAAGFSCQGIRLAAQLSLSEIGGGTGSDHWGWVHEPSGRLFALMGRSNGTAFVEVTDPDQPVYLGNLPRPSGVSDSPLTDIKVYQDHALIVADSAGGQGIQVFDLTRLLDAGASAPISFDADAHYTGFDEAHNIAINEDSGFAYAVGGEECAGGLVMVDVRQPTQPQPAGCFSADGYTHDVQCVIYRGPDSDFWGREICFASNEDSLTVVDVTDKARPELVARHLYDHGYTHQGWLGKDQRYFFLDDELDEQTRNLPGTRTLVFDLIDLDGEVVPAEYFSSNLTFDHNQYVFGDYVFQANYEQGLRILEIDDAGSAALTERAWFDTHPESDGLDFVGAWSVFPFFYSNIVLVSDFSRGLFVLEVTDSDIADALRDPLFSDRFGP